MKIAIFTDSFFPCVGGTEKAVLGLASALSKKHDVLVACPRYDGKHVDDYSFTVARAISLPVNKRDHWALPALSPKFKKQIMEFEPDVIHCNTISSMARYGIKIARKLNIPIIITVHTKFKDAFNKAIKLKPVVSVMLKDIATKLKKCDKVTTVSNDMIPELSSYGYHGDVSVVRNGATFQKPDNLPQLYKSADKKYDLEDKFVFLFVGLVIKYKNIEFSLKALKEIKKTNDNFIFVIVGEGPDTEYFKNAVEKYDLKDNVIFTGLIRDKELLSTIYARADLFLFPSIFDNDPLTIVEAAIHETPAITLLGTGSSERIESEKTGFIVENDLEKYTDKIAELIKDKESLKQIGQKASQSIPKTWETTAEEYLKEYSKLIEKKKHTQ